MESGKSGRRVAEYQLGEDNEEMETFVHLFSKYLRTASMPGTRMDTTGCAKICKTHVPTFGD